ncbi:MAG: hypothetical protein N2035_03845 [Chthoniobacterales bacterium]|nr:hypothetical protein [Chthoniobacterales bacterium]
MTKLSFRLAFRLALFLLSAAILSQFCLAQTHDTPQPTISFQDFPATEINDVIIPVPSEIFNVLDKLGSPNWHATILESRPNSTSSRTHTALLLGITIADGFLAVQAKDSEKIKEIGRDVLSLSEALGVRDAVIARSKSIIDQAEKKDWRQVRIEFDGALQDVRSAMRQLNDEPIAQLVSLAGWLRGTHAVTSIILNNYSPERAELLHQPDLIAYFDRQLDSLPQKLKKDNYVRKIRPALSKIMPLLGIHDGSSISPDNVAKINQITSELIQNILTTEE